LKKLSHPEDLNTQLRILKSARSIFHTKGLEGARMQEIADHAGINKAMLHYYYRSKEKLFDAVFEEAIERLIPKLRDLLNAEMPLFEKIEFFVDNYLSLLLNNMYMPVFLVNEMNQNPERFVKTLSEKLKLKPDVFISQIKKASKEGLIKHVDPGQLFVNLISMCVFPFVARPMIMGGFGMSEADFARFIKKRKKEIPKFVIDSIKAKRK